ncbi:MAG: hypothetical protein RLZZ543_1374 [Bacteroidota bacterium]
MKKPNFLLMQIVFQNKNMKKIALIFGGLLLLGSLQAQTTSLSTQISTLYNDGVRLIGEKKYAEARLKLDQAVRLKGDYAEAVFARGTCSLMLQERDKACMDFVKASQQGWKPADEYIKKYCAADAVGRKMKAIEPIKPEGVAK